MKTTLVLMTLAVAGGRAMGAEAWRYCGHFEPIPIAYYVEISSVRIAGEYRSSTWLSLMESGASKTPVTVSCRTFYSWTGRNSPILPERSAPLWRAAQILCGTDGPVEN